MLEAVLRYINNRFDRKANGERHGSRTGAFTVKDGLLEVDGLLEGQYYWVEGSALNDGLHLYPDYGMQDETFVGKVVFLVIPKAVVELADEISVWCRNNSETINSPYQSESFGGYSYSKASGAALGNQAPSAAWQTHFGAMLRPYRKISRDWV